MYNKYNLWKARQVAVVDAKIGPIHGWILDADTSEPVIGATIRVTGTTDFAWTDFSGWFRMQRIPFGSYHIEIKHLNYIEVTLEQHNPPEGSVSCVVVSLHKKPRKSPVILSILLGRNPCGFDVAGQDPRGPDGIPPAASL